MLYVCAMSPIFGRRARPLYEASLHVPTVHELARIIAERLEALDAFGGSCPSCRHAELRALLATLRRIVGPTAPNHP